MADDKTVKPMADDKTVKPMAPMTPATPMAPMTPATPMADTKAKTTDPIGAREGFNMRDRERIMQKGKRSSDIMGIANIRRQSDDAVEPNDPSGFTDNAAPF
jgi:hypothetical protein